MLAEHQSAAMSVYYRSLAPDDLSPKIVAPLPRSYSKTLNYLHDRSKRINGRDHQSGGHVPRHAGFFDDHCALMIPASVPIAEEPDRNIGNLCGHDRLTSIIFLGDAASAGMLNNAIVEGVGTRSVTNNLDCDPSTRLHHRTEALTQR